MAYRSYINPSKKKHAQINCFQANQFRVER